jgi:UrcA family protein
MRHAKLTVLLAALTAGMAQVALADMSSEPLSVQVKYADLDLSQTADAKTLYQRLASAAGSVCEPYNGGELVNIHRFQACVRQAISTAVADVNSALLTSYYESKGGTRLQRVAQLDR